MSVEYTLYQKVLFRLLFVGLLTISIFAVYMAFADSPWDYMICAGVVLVWIVTLSIAKVPNKREDEKNFSRVVSYFALLSTFGTFIGLLVRFTENTFSWNDLPFVLILLICILIGWIKVENKEVSIELYEAVGWETLVPTCILLLSGGFSYFNFGLLIMYYLFLKLWFLDWILYGFKEPVLTRTAIYHASLASFWCTVVICCMVHLSR